MPVGHPSIAARRPKSCSESGVLIHEFDWKRPTASQLQVMIASVESKSDLREVIRLCHSRIAKLEAREIAG